MQSPPRTFARTVSHSTTYSAQRTARTPVHARTVALHAAVAHHAPLQRWAGQGARQRPQTPSMSEMQMTHARARQCAGAVAHWATIRDAAQPTLLTLLQHASTLQGHGARAPGRGDARKGLQKVGRAITKRSGCCVLPSSPLLFFFMIRRSQRTEDPLFHVCSASPAYFCAVHCARPHALSVPSHRLLLRGPHPAHHPEFSTLVCPSGSWAEHTARERSDRIAGGTRSVILPLENAFARPQPRLQAFPRLTLEYRPLNFSSRARQGVSLTLGASQRGSGRFQQVEKRRDDGLRFAVTRGRDGVRKADEQRQRSLGKTARRNVRISLCCLCG